jgi:competence protein ComEA
MDTAPDEPPLRRAARWLQATPLELVGLAILLAGALAASVALWWTASARPNELPSAVLDVGVDPSGTDQDQPAASSPPQAGGAEGATTEAADDGPDTPAELTVHVTGAVVTPGLVVVDGSARVGDAVSAAGGLTSEAAPELVNLARPLTDGEHVHVPQVGEDPLPPDGSGTDGADPGASEPGTDPEGRIDLNHATVEQLETLPGIGPAKADAIVQHREAHGPFAVPGDLRAVPGIGEATFQRLADLVTVG